MTLSGVDLMVLSSTLSLSAAASAMGSVVQSQKKKLFEERSTGAYKSPSSSQAYYKHKTRRIERFAAQKQRQCAVCSVQCAVCSCLMSSRQDDGVVCTRTRVYSTRFRRKKC